MATLITRKNRPSPYAVRWELPDGRAIERSFPTRSEAELFRAQKNVELFEARKRRPRVRSSTVPTFRAVGEAYVAMKEHPRRGEPLEPITLRVYRTYLSEMIFPFVGNKKVSEVDRRDFENVYDTAVLLGRARKTKKEALRLMKAVLKHAQKSGYINEVPDQDLNIFTALRKILRSSGVLLI